MQILLFVFINPSLAQEDLSNPKLKLEELTINLKGNKERQRALENEVRSIAADRAKLNERLIQTARRIQESEKQIDVAEKRLTQLGDHQRLLRASLASRQDELAEFLAALQRLGRNPPPAMAVKPNDALDAVRSAILLGTVVPELNHEAVKITADLTELIDIQKRISDNKNALAQQTAALIAERERIELLVATKRQTFNRLNSDLVAVRKNAEKLSEKTNSLKELIEQMDAQLAKQTQSADIPDTPKTKEQQLAALSDPGRIAPAIPFSDVRGTLSLPVIGATLTRFGEQDDFGSVSKGISIATRDVAQVTSPCDGWIVYSGPFRSYGKLLILNAGNGYHVVMAGIDRLDVELGQFVVAGEPLGVMGKKSAHSQALAVSPDEERPILYVEFRKDGSSIDPDPWWVSNEEKVRG